MPMIKVMIMIIAIVWKVVFVNSLKLRVYKIIRTDEAIPKINSISFVFFFLLDHIHFIENPRLSIATIIRYKYKKVFIIKMK